MADFSSSCSSLNLHPSASCSLSVPSRSRYPLLTTQGLLLTEKQIGGWQIHTSTSAPSLWTFSCAYFYNSIASSPKIQILFHIASTQIYLFVFHWGLWDSIAIEYNTALIIQNLNVHPASRVNWIEISRKWRMPIQYLLVNLKDPLVK